MYAKKIISCLLSAVLVASIFISPTFASHAQDSPSEGGAALAVDAASIPPNATASLYTGNLYTVTVHFDVGKGKPLAQDTLTFNTKQASSVVLPCPTPPDSGHVFAGWYLQKRFADGSGWSGWQLRLTSENGTWYGKAYGTEIREFCRDYEISGDIKLRALYIKTLSHSNVENANPNAKKLNVAIKKWNLKSVVKASFEKGAPVCRMDLKIGTAQLAKVPKANMVFEAGRYTIIVFKGKKTADVYAFVSASNRKKKRTVVTKYFKYDSYSCQCNEGYCRDVVGAKAGYVGSMANVRSYDEHTLFMPFYGKGGTGANMMKAGSSVTAPAVKKKIKFVITWKSLSLKGKLQTGSPFYKKAEKMVGEYSVSCDDTAMKLAARVAPDGGWSTDDLCLPTDKARSGDFLAQQGHTSVYLGGGQSLHGSVTTHKTWIGSSYIRKTYYASRTYWSVFYCQKYR